MPTIYTFDSTGEAYDTCQCNDTIHNGDVLLVPSEGVVGILLEAWPVAITPEYGAFHALAEGVIHDEFWPCVAKTRGGGTYDLSESLALARRLFA